MSSESTDRCPECGRAVADRSVPKPDRPLHWRVMSPAVVAVALAIGIITWSALTAETFFLGSGTPRTYFVDPPFTRADVETIAASERPDSSSSLIDAILHVPWLRHEKTGEVFIFAAFQNPQADRLRTLTFGWPSAWYTRSERSRYQNALTKASFQPLNTDQSLPMSEGSYFYPGKPNPPPRPRWGMNQNMNWSLAYRPPVEETAGVELFVDIGLLSIVSSLGLVVLGWMAGTLLHWMLNVSSFRRKPMRRRPLRWILAGAVLTVILIQASQSRTVTEQVSSFEMGQQLRVGAGTYWKKSSVYNTGLRVSDLDHLVNDPLGNQQVARTLLAGIPQGASDAYLGIEPTSEAVAAGTGVFYGGRLRLYSRDSYQIVRRPDLGSSVFLTKPRGTNMSMGYGWLKFETSSGDPNMPISGWSLNLDAVGTIAVGVLISWLIARAICRIIVAFTIRRRRARGQCVACGYFITAPKTA